MKNERNWDISDRGLTPEAYLFLAERVERLYFSGASFIEAMDRVTGVYAKI